MPPGSGDRVPPLKLALCAAAVTLATLWLIGVIP